MAVTLSVVRRTLAVPAVVPLVLLSAGSAFVATTLARGQLGGTEAFVDEVRHGSLLFAGLLTLSLAEPLEVGRDARGGQLLLRAARGGGFALLARCLGLLVSTSAVVVVAAVASGGLPVSPLALLGELLVLCAGGLALGAFVDRARLVPCLLILLVAGHLQAWILAGGPVGLVGWLLPRLGALEGWPGLVHAALWSLGALLIAEGRLRLVVGRPG